MPVRPQQTRTRRTRFDTALVNQLRAALHEYHPAKAPCGNWRAGEEFAWSKPQRPRFLSTTRPFGLGRRCGLAIRKDVTERSLVETPTVHEDLRRVRALRRGGHGRDGCCRHTVVVLCQHDQVGEVNTAVVREVPSGPSASRRGVVVLCHSHEVGECHNTVQIGIAGGGQSDQNGGSIDRLSGEDGRPGPGQTEYVLRLARAQRVPTNR